MFSDEIFFHSSRVDSVHCDAMQISQVDQRYPLTNEKKQKKTGGRDERSKTIVQRMIRTGREYR